MIRISEDITIRPSDVAVILENPLRVVMTLTAICYPVTTMDYPELKLQCDDFIKVSDKRTVRKSAIVDHWASDTNGGYYVSVVTAEDSVGCSSAEVLRLL